MGTVLKKAKPLNKLRPVERGSPFAVRVLAFLTTSLSAWRSVISFLQSVEIEKPSIVMARTFPKKMKKMYVL
jgi:hypothetical protein